MAWTEKDLILAFIQLLPIILIWVRLEKRLSRLEGRYDQMMNGKQIAASCTATSHGSKEGGS